MKSIQKICFSIVVLCSTSASLAQEMGFIFPSRLGVSVQQTTSIDVGLISFNQYNERGALKYYDISLGVESYFTKPFTMAPKLNFDFGVGLLAGGVNVSLPTDFSQTTWMVTPKIGLNLFSIVRVYYGYHIFHEMDGFPNLGKHYMSLEVNIAAFHDFKIGL
ncbi:hypothetical protein [Sinomicrobium sp.]